MKTAHGAPATLAYALAGAALGVLIGVWEGHVFLWAGLYALAVAGWLLWQREKFAQWLQRGGDNLLHGRWGQLAQRVSQRLAHHRARNRALEQTLRRYREASALFPDGLVMLDGERRIEWMNDAAARMLDLDPARDVGQTIHHLVRHPELLESLENAYTSDRVILESPVEVSRFIALQTLSVRPDQHLLIVRDVTDFENAETERRDFVANASHELRSPLTVIRGYLDALVDDQTLDPEWAGPVVEMQRQARRMSDMLRDLMDLARLDRIYHRAEFKPVAIEPLLQRIRRDQLVGAGNGRSVTLDIVSSSDLYGEEAEIALIVTNLLSNALRYTGGDGNVNIRWHTDATGGHLEVLDDGIGIPEEHIPRLTQRFYRVDKGRSRERGGTGLGLAIAHNALVRHDAHLEVRSRLGEGSAFICHFPPARIAVCDSGLLTASGA